MAERLKILLADDENDRFFFNNILKHTDIFTLLDAVLEDEEYLLGIKNKEAFKNVPVIIYSTLLHKRVAEPLYSNAAYYNIKKDSLSLVETTLPHVLNILIEQNFARS